MFIVIHCGGMPFNGSTIHERSLGGSETAAYYVAKELAARGHHVRLFTSHKEEGTWDGVGYVYAGPANAQNPYGERFHFYAMATPMDVLIIQRAPQAFAMPWAAKVNILWLHDLALWQNQDQMKANCYNLDRIFTVSNFLKKQVEEVYALVEKAGDNCPQVVVIPNGIDPPRYGSVQDLTTSKSLLEKFWKDKSANETKLLYVSRPERGLVNLVGIGAIMEKLAKEAPDVHLYVCGYDNTTQHMAPFYNRLWARIEELPNCTNLGALTQGELALVQKQVAAWVYPTSFEETSCIAAMEFMAAGTQVIHTGEGALSETLHGYKNQTIIPLVSGEVDVDAFVNGIKKLKRYGKKRPATPFTWQRTAAIIEREIIKAMSASSKEAIASHLLRNSDILALSYFLQHSSNVHEESSIMSGIRSEVMTNYDFAFKKTFAEHYQAYYQYEQDRGITYGPEELQGNSRFEAVARRIGEVENHEGKVVLDYGCAHGHYTINLAKRFPDLKFVGADISKSNIQKAREWAKEEGLYDRISFVQVETPHALEAYKFDITIAAEVLEHVVDYSALMNGLSAITNEEGMIIVTTPYGPWEAQGYKQHWPWRAHLHHFEREDLQEIFGHYEGFEVKAIPSGHTDRAEAIGSYITSFLNSGRFPSGKIDYERKLNWLNPKGTLSVCMIVHNSESSIKRCLESIGEIATELIIGLDENTDDGTEEIIYKFICENPQIAHSEVFRIESPLVAGFSEARNKTLAKASGDWIFWIDSDEILIHGELLPRILSHGLYKGYALNQHHFACEPAGVMKVDLPCKVFKNHRGVKFFGLCHEHPETGINEGVGHALLVPDIEVVHAGYETEDIRRKRFERNLPLLKKDRELNPERWVGRYLWVRDLAQLNGYEMELNGGVITNQIIERANEGIELWEGILKEGELRMVNDGMEFYSALVGVTGEGFEASISIEAAQSLNGATASIIKSKFASKEHFGILLDRISKDRLANIHEKY